MTENEFWKIINETYDDNSKEVSLAIKYENSVMFEYGIHKYEDILRRIPEEAEKIRQEEKKPRPPVKYNPISEEVYEEIDDEY